MLNVVKRTQIAIHTNLKSYRESTEMMLVILLKILTRLCFFTQISEVDPYYFQELIGVMV